ncbi:cupin domain-containing protein [Altererythrobacter sp. MF3-039]|uniref:cupin domain-containing protein n=1 Tax=Altererythrobacter sp. MF3-039 TaxID=3252901 RepID=UPI00390C5884
MSAEELIAELGFAPHPEGGWFRETWRAPTIDGERTSSTAILFLLKSHERSHWHRVDADEIWLWHQGDALKLLVAADEDSPPLATLLGPSGDSGHGPQKVIPAGHWQAAEPQPGGQHGYVLVSCVVAPGFEFSGFEMAVEGWKPGR